MSNNNNLLEGTISYVSQPDKGFGFIMSKDLEKPMFFHASELQDMLFPDVKIGDPVTFLVGSNNRGKQCVNISKKISI